MPNTTITMQAIPNLPAIKPQDNLTDLIIQALEAAQLSLQDGDILVISSKIISKAEGRFVDLKSITPSARALELAEQSQKDPRVVELVLRESTEVSRTAPNVLIVQHRLGFTSANAGIDASNTGVVSEDILLLLPENPDQSAQGIRAELQMHFGVQLGIIISDTHGRPFRLGNLNVAIGLAGIPALVDQRGDVDLFGRVLRATITPLADELAPASGLVSGQADEGQPVVLMRGVQWEVSESHATQLIRPPEQDLYR